MLNDQDKAVGIITMKLISFSLFIFSVFLFFEKDIIFTGIALVCISFYFGLLGWNIIKKSNYLYLSLMAIFSISLSFEVGINFELIVVLAIVYISFYYINYILIDDEN